MSSLRRSRLMVLEVEEDGGVRVDGGGGPLVHIVNPVLVRVGVGGGTHGHRPDRVTVVAAHSTHPALPFPERKRKHHRGRVTNTKKEEELRRLAWLLHDNENSPAPSKPNYYYPEKKTQSTVYYPLSRPLRRSTFRQSLKRSQLTPPRLNACLAAAPRCGV